MGSIYRRITAALYLSGSEGRTDGPLWHSNSASGAGDAYQLTLGTHRRLGHGLSPKAATSLDVCLVREMGTNLPGDNTSVWFWYPMTSAVVEQVRPGFMSCWLCPCEGLHALVCTLAWDCIAAVLRSPCSLM